MICNNLEAIYIKYTLKLVWKSTEGKTT